MASNKTFIGKNLKFLRKHLHHSQTTLGQEIGLSRNNIASYESGLVEPSTKNLLKMTKLFNVSVQRFLEEDFSLLDSNQLENIYIKDTPLEIHLPKNIQDHLKDFTNQTDKMSKILEGYQEFYNMQKAISQSPQERDLYNTMDNILDLLRSLVITNNTLISKLD